MWGRVECEGMSVVLECVVLVKNMCCLVLVVFFLGWGGVFRKERFLEFYYFGREIVVLGLDFLGFCEIWCKFCIGL